MVRVYRQNAQGIIRSSGIENLEDPTDLLWIDLITPEPQELRQVERLLNIELPTRDDMREIEASSRLYTESGARFMTTTVLARVDTETPELAEITFILLEKVIVTLRLTDSYSFRMFAAQLLKHRHSNRDLVFLGLLESIIDRQADVLERFGAELDITSKAIFQSKEQRSSSNKKKKVRNDKELKQVIETLGRTGDLITRQRDCLVNLTRLITYASQEDIDTGAPSGLYQRLKPLGRDISSLSEYANFLSSKVNFMLDATLGLINIEQNEIVKIFTVASVIFLPPTLIASIYGMNFEHMPELRSSYGYFISLGMMLFSAVVPLMYFRRRGWL